MSIWYETGSQHSITEVEVSKHTAQSIWVGNRRRGISTEWYTYHPTKAEALAYLLNRAKHRVSNAESLLQQERSALGEIQAMCSQANPQGESK